MFVFACVFIKMCAFIVQVGVCLCVSVLVCWHVCISCAGMLMRVPFFMALLQDVLEFTCMKVLGSVCVCVCEKSSFVSNQVSSLQISISVFMFCACARVCVCVCVCVWGGTAGLMSTERTQFSCLFLSKLQCRTSVKMNSVMKMLLNLNYPHEPQMNRY